ncbi:MAG: HI0074 family nucleotidyltransferase substrate-binding subunit [Rubrivivax sp.]
MNSDDRQRFEQQRGYFEQALVRLGEVLQVAENEIVRDALIQRFEFTHEMAWKTMFRFLVSKGERVAAKAWDVLPLAFQSQLVADAGTWERMRAMRNDMSHEYDRAKAVAVAAFVRDKAYPAMLALQAELQRRA